MSLGHGSSIVREGLVFYVDSSNIKSYPGAGTTWKDLSGNAFDVQLPAGVTYDSPYMAFGGSSMIDLGNNPTLLSNDLTYEAWVKPASIPSWMGVISCVPSWGSGFGLQVGSTWTSSNGEWLVSKGGNSARNRNMVSFSCNIFFS